VAYVRFAVVADDTQLVLRAGAREGISDDPFIAAGYVHTNEAGPGQTTHVWLDPVDPPAVGDPLPATPPADATVSGGRR
jgi:hypothetical protein